MVAKELELPEGEVETGLSQGSVGDLRNRSFPPESTIPAETRPPWRESPGKPRRSTASRVLIGSRRAPIRAIALVLQKVLKAAGGKIEVLVLLCGERDPRRRLWKSRKRSGVIFWQFTSSARAWKDGARERERSHVRDCRGGQSWKIVRRFGPSRKTIEVRISSMPGETVSCQRFWLRDLFAFYDTPGFQNAIEALRELEPAGRASEPLEVFRSFLKRHQDEADFEAELRLLSRSSRKMRESFTWWTARNRSSKFTSPRWKFFGSRASRAWRLSIELKLKTTWPNGDAASACISMPCGSSTLIKQASRTAWSCSETLAGIEQRWKPQLMSAVAIFREEWEKRLDDCAEIMVELLQDALNHCEMTAGSELSSRRKEIRKRSSGGSWTP